MTDTINPVGPRVATIELWRMPDGAVHGRLRHMEPALIEGMCSDVPDHLQVPNRLFQVADWMVDAALQFSEEAKATADESQ